MRLNIYLANLLVGAVPFVSFPHRVTEYYDNKIQHFLTNRLGKALDPSITNPLFIDEISSAAIRKPAPSLQSKLDDLINRVSLPDNIVNKNREKISIALVKMKVGKADPVSSDPEFAGWQEQKSYYAASAAKIAALYAVFQLREELNYFIATTSEDITNITSLESEVKKDWKNVGLVNGLPNINKLFSFASDAPAMVNFTPKVQNTLKSFSASNTAVTDLIRNLGFHYIASLMLASGLYSPITSGVWLREDYDNNHENRTKFPSKEDPYPSRYMHNITALAAARFFVLMEQGRLISKRDSAEMTSALNMKSVLNSGGCMVDNYWVPNIKAAKCGYESDNNPEWQHDAFIYESATKRYVMVLLTHGVGNDYPIIRNAVQAIL